jgi:peptidoglycan/LPS O-acetylase OafA/YrhL
LSARRFSNDAGLVAYSSVVKISSGRIPSLDGLRGVAALVVVVHRALLVVPSLAAPYMSGYEDVEGIARWLLYSPLHLVWAGTEAVYVFFVLSGFVLARSVLSASSFDWLAYFPSRLTRLYLPVVGAVGFAVLTILIVPRVGEESAWVMFHPSTYTAQTLLDDITLIGGTSNVVAPLWSLQWEVLFSLLLPVFVLVARGRWFVATTLICLVLTTVGYLTGVLIVAFMPMFAVGVALAYQWSRIERISSAVSARPGGNFAWPIAVALASALLCSYWLLYPIFGSGTQLLTWTRPLVVVGAAVLVVSSALWSPLRRLLSRRIFQWLGIISFSLYLVHDPIVVASAFLIGSSKWTVVLAIVVSLVVAVAFYIVVERPSHRLARSLGRRTAVPPSL